MNTISKLRQLITRKRINDKQGLYDLCDKAETEMDTLIEMNGKILKDWSEERDVLVKQIAELNKKIDAIMDYDAKLIRKYKDLKDKYNSIRVI